MQRLNVLIGQRFLANRLTSMIEKGTVPRTLVLTGPEGQGKATAARWLAERMSTELVEHEAPKVDDVRAIIEDSFTLHKPKMYLLLNAHNMTYQAQNALLKFTEEPSPNAYICMTAFEAGKLLPTIISRSMVMPLASYSEIELEHFLPSANDRDVLKVCSNPGQIKRMCSIDYSALLDLAKKVVDNIGKVSAANTFNILKHVKDEDVDLLIPMLKYYYGQELMRGSDVYEQLKVIQQYHEEFQMKSSNKKNLMEMLFIDLRKVTMWNSQP